jgi:hypothetical protein
MTKMTNGERSELISLCKQRAKLAKQMASYRAADLRADFEAQLAAEYAWDDDEVWAEARRIADEATADANTRIVERRRELGIPAQLRRRLTVSGASAARTPRGSAARSGGRWPAPASMR